MARRFLVAVVAAMLATSAAHAQTAFVIAGGLNAPVGDLGDFTDIGYNLTAGVNIGAPMLPVGIRLEGGYNSVGYKAGGGDIRILTATANAIFNLGTTKDAPYLIAGLGAYNRSESSAGLGYVNGATSVGINGGAGLRFPLTGLSTFVEARYHVMLGDSRDGANYQFIPIVFGIQF